MKPGKDHPWVRDAVAGFRRHQQKARRDGSDHDGPQHEKDEMKFYTDDDRVERIIATLAKLSLDDLFAVEVALEQAARAAKGRARDRANQIIFPDRK